MAVSSGDAGQAGTGGELDGGHSEEAQRLTEIEWDEGAASAVVTVVVVVSSAAGVTKRGAAQPNTRKHPDPAPPACAASDLSRRPFVRPRRAHRHRRRASCTRYMSTTRLHLQFIIQYTPVCAWVTIRTAYLCDITSKSERLCDSDALKVRRIPRIGGEVLLQEINELEHV